MTKLFGTTGVRKIYGTEFDVEMALKLGKSLGTYLKEGTVLIARDARTTGLMIADALSAGLLSTGVNVVRGGIIPTPTLALMTRELGYDAGLMVTASHNPPEYTGVKFWGADSMGLTQDVESKLEEIFHSEQYQVATWKKLGNESSNGTLVASHIERLLERCDVDKIRSKKYKVIVDPGNGAACVLTPYLMQELGCKVVTVNGQLDGHFPGRKSEPEKESLTDLIRLIENTGADLGIAHDGDSDRVVFVTETGEVIRGDRTIAFLAQEYLKTTASKTIVTTVDSSQVLDETVKKAGGETIRTPVGDIQVAIKIRDEDAAMGGEACGVFIFPEFHLAPEPFLAACKILEIMAKTDKSFGSLITNIPIYPLQKSKVPCANELKPKAMEKLSDVLPKAMGDVVEVLTVDGLGVFLKKGWVLVRPSGTEPIIRITCEAPEEEITQNILKQAKSIVEETMETL
ncbi:MAG: phosphoglucosamine mutase [Candidatus Lokiarchaeota archaeon]|nr:phosphoglucosamine mutase [Candidatus Lokiarchaeota archaeon]